MSYRNYTNEDIINNSKEVKSIAGLIKSLGLKPVGGNYYTMKSKLKQLEIDTSHWTGQAWNKGEQLKDWSNYVKLKHVRKHLIKDRGRKCERCNLTKWFDAPIPIHVHHIDGNRTNNKYENLLLVCPNCHALEHK